MIVMPEKQNCFNDSFLVQGEFLSFNRAGYDFPFFLLVLYEDSFVLVPALTEKQAFSLAHELQADGIVPVQLVQRLHVFA